MFVYSTLSCSVKYEVGGREIIINGGANVTNKNLWTPRGIATKLSREDVDTLRKNKSFQDAEKAGFMAVSLVERNPDKVAKDMKAEDKSAQKTWESTEKETQAKRHK